MKIYSTKTLTTSLKLGPGLWIQILKNIDPYKKTWTLRNMDPEKRGINMSFENMSHL